MQTTAISRNLSWVFWFLFIPLGGAYVAVRQVAQLDALGPLAEFARGQTVPAFIAAFSLIEAACWGSRHRLPFWDPLAHPGMGDVPAASRRDYEAAEQLLEEAHRTLRRHERSIASRLKPAEVDSLHEALGALRSALTARPFEAADFHRVLDSTQRQVSAALRPWQKSEAREYFESIGAAILVALLLRAVVFEAFKIPSGSMRPTLLVGDHIFVAKFSYGPKLPLLGKRLFPNMPPKRGDVIVFEFPDLNPRNERQDFIKRVIAVPGDTLEVEGGHPIINGWRVPSCLVGEGQLESDSGFPRRGQLFMEYLEDRAYLTLYQGEREPRFQGPYKVGPEEVWVLGDNRHNSMDSREWDRPGGGKGAGAPFDNIKGRALVIWLPLERLFRLVMGTPELPDGLSDDLKRGVERCLAERPPLSATTPPARAAAP